MEKPDIVIEAEEFLAHVQRAKDAVAKVVRTHAEQASRVFRVVKPEEVQHAVECAQEAIGELFYEEACRKREIIEEFNRADSAEAVRELSSR